MALKLPQALGYVAKGKSSCGCIFSEGLVGCVSVVQSHSLDNLWLAFPRRNGFQQYPTAHCGNLTGMVNDGPESEVEL